VTATHKRLLADVMRDGNCLWHCVQQWYQGLQPTAYIFRYYAVSSEFETLSDATETSFEPVTLLEQNTHKKALAFLTRGLFKDPSV
jgi:hypothetical protein